MPVNEYTDIAVVAFPAATGKGGGYKDVASNVIAVTTAISMAAAELKKRAAEITKDDKEREPLPIFVAPQWTWRKSAGIYDVEDVEEIYEILLATSKKHRDVLIFPGTI